MFNGTTQKDPALIPLVMTSEISITNKIEYEMMNSRFRMYDLTKEVNKIMYLD